MFTIPDEDNTIEDFTSMKPKPSKPIGSLLPTTHLVGLQNNPNNLLTMTDQFGSMSEFSGHNFPYNMPSCSRNPNTQSPLNKKLSLDSEFIYFLGRKMKKDQKNLKIENQKLIEIPNSINIFKDLEVRDITLNLDSKLQREQDIKYITVRFRI